MGRNETDDLSAAQIFYPCMQCADIFFLKVRKSLPLSPDGTRHGNMEYSYTYNYIRTHSCSMHIDKSHALG